MKDIAAFKNNDEEVVFCLEVTDVLVDAQSRQANQSVRIHNQKLLNGKNELRHSPTARVMVDRNASVNIKPTQFKKV